jgi:hypothetical protein
MFSDEGRTLDEETVEYAWLVEIQLGKLSGKLTAPQVRHYWIPSGREAASYSEVLVTTHNAT